MYLIIITLISFLVLGYILFNCVKYDDRLQQKKKKLAFLFLTTDMIQGDSIWKAFFKGHESKYNIYIHPKYVKAYENKDDNDNKNFWKPHIIPNLVSDTGWGNISLVKATLNLLSWAFEDDPENYKFILVCDKTLPIKSFDYMYRVLCSDNDNNGDGDVSWFNFYQPTWENVNHFRSLLMMKNRKELEDKGSFFHQEQWMILNRKHTKIVIDNAHWVDYFPKNEISFADECFFITVLASVIGRKQLASELKFPQCGDYWEYKKHDKIMWAKWFTDRTLHPKTYPFNDVDDELINELYESPCLFARKFVKEVGGDGELWQKWEKLLT